MKKFLSIAAATAALAVAAPASAATVTYGLMNPSGNVVLSPNGPGALKGFLGFTVSGTPGGFTATFNFLNPFSPAAATGSASFDYDPDVVNFTGGSFGDGSVVNITNPGGTGSSITVSLANLEAGSRTLTLTGNFNPDGLPTGGNRFAAIGGSINLTGGVVPEPTTWALFIIGFGAVGYSLRRRNVAVRSIKSKLNFA